MGIIICKYSFTLLAHCIKLHHMVTKTKPIEVKQIAITVRLDVKESEMISRLRESLGLKNYTEVVRQACRALAEAKGVSQ